MVERIAVHVKIILVDTAELAGKAVVAIVYAVGVITAAKKRNALGLTVIRNEITYQLLADGFRVHTKLPSDS